MRIGFIHGLAMTVITALVMSFAYAGDPGDGKITAGTTGNYLGIQAGPSYINATTEELPDSEGNIVTVKPTSQSFGMRVYWGYQFTNYLGLEGGYGYYGSATYGIPNGNSPQIRLQGLDLLGKFILPLPFSVSVFGKVGPALMFYKQGGTLVPNPNPGGASGSTGVAVRPEYALGIDWAFTPNWHLDLTGTRVTAGGVVPKESLLSVGISYHAVDLWCGQFLC